MDIRIESGSAGTAIAGHATNFESLCGIEMGTSIPCEILEVRAMAKSAGTNDWRRRSADLRSGCAHRRQHIALWANITGGPTELNAAPFTTFFAAQPGCVQSSVEIRVILRE